MDESLLESLRRYDEAIAAWKLVSKHKLKKDFWLAQFRVSGKPADLLRYWAHSKLYEENLRRC